MRRKGDCLEFESKGNITEIFEDTFDSPVLSFLNSLYSITDKHCEGETVFTEFKKLINI